MANEFTHDDFLSHSAKDKAVVRAIAERLREAGLRLWPVSPKRLRAGGFDEWVLKPGDSIPAKIDPPTLRSYGGKGEGLEHSRVFAFPAEAFARRRTCPAGALRRRRMLCMSANAFGSDWAQLACPAVASLRRRKAGTCGRGNLPFRDPPNQERRFIPLRLDDAPIQGSRAPFLYINWLHPAREQEYAKR